MNKTEFANAVVEAAKVALGEDYTVSVQEVVKNNGISLTGLMIRKEGQNVAPTIYLNGYHELYEEGETFEDIMNRILNDYHRGKVASDVDVSFFEYFDQVQDRICFRLINTERNKTLLEDVPNVPFLDLSIVFFYAYHGEEIGDGSILIHNDHLDRWGMTVEDLMEVAKENTPRLFPLEVQSMLDTMKALVGDDPEMLRDAESSPMTIISNRQRVNGAVTLLYPHVLREVAEKEDSNLYVLPSSIHEFIVLPEAKVPDADFLRSMICEVNRTQLHAAEILSDTLYFYDKEEGNLRIA